MDWIKWIKSALRALLLFGIVLLVCWIWSVVTNGELDLITVVIAYMLSETSIRYYEKEESK